MKRILRFLMALSAVLLCAGRLHAMQELVDVTPDRAKELGISATTRTSGDGMTCYELTFPTTGELKEFARVELRLDANGKGAIYAPLQTTRPDDKTASAYFCVHKDVTEAATVTISIRGPLGGIAYLIHLAKLPVTSKDTPPAAPPVSSQPMKPAPPASGSR